MAALSFPNRGWVQLSPAGTQSVADGQRLAGWAIAGAAGFFLTATLAVITAGVARCRWLAILPAAVAVTLAVPLSTVRTSGSGSCYGRKRIFKTGGFVCLRTSPLSVPRVRAVVVRVSSTGVAVCSGVIVVSRSGVPGAAIDYGFERSGGGISVGPPIPTKRL